MAYLNIIARQEEIDSHVAAMVASAGVCREAISSGSSRFASAIKESRKKTEGRDNEAGLRNAYSVAKRQLTKANELLEEAAVALLDAAEMVMRTSQECDRAQSVIVASCIRFANRQAVSGDSMHASLPAASSSKRRGPEPAKPAAAKLQPETKPSPSAVLQSAVVSATSPSVVLDADAAKSPGRKRSTPSAKPGAKRTRRSKKDIQAALEESTAAKSKGTESWMV